MLSAEALAATLNVPAQYATVQLAFDAAQPGDTIVLAAGTYNESVRTKRSGTSDSRIVIDGQNVATIKQISLSHQYITIQNVTFKGAVNQYSYFIYFGYNSHYIIFQNNVIDGDGRDAYAIQWANPTSSYPWGDGSVASHCTITNNEIKNTRHMPVMYLGGEYNTVSNNYFHDAQRAEAWVRFFGRYNTFTQNIFANNIHTPWTDGHPDTFETSAVYLPNSGCLGAYNIVFNRNFIYNSSGDAQNIMLDLKMDPNVRNIYFLNNIFVQSGTYDSLMAPNTYFFNNTFYNHLDPDRGGVGRSFGCREYTTDSCTGSSGTICATGSRVYNNIFLDGGTGGGTPNQTGMYSFSPSSPPVLSDVEADYNYVAKELSGVPYSAMAVDSQHRAIGSSGGWSNWLWWEPNGMNGGNPYLVNAFHGCTHVTCNLRLTENTPAKIRDGGKDLTSLWPAWIPMTDYDGNPRPSGSGWSIGAFEYGISPDSPAPPSNLCILQ